MGRASSLNVSARFPRSVRCHSRARNQQRSDASFVKKTDAAAGREISIGERISEYLRAYGGTVGQLVGEHTVEQFTILYQHATVAAQKDRIYRALPHVDDKGRKKLERQLEELDAELEYVNEDVVEVDSQVMMNKALKKFDDIMQFFSE